MSRLSEHQRGILACSMSDVTAGALLGRSAAWVARMRREIDAADQGDAPAAEAVADVPAVAPVAVPRAARKVRKPASRPVATPARVIAVRAQPSSSGVRRLKPVTPNIARWGGWFLAARWPADQVADLFGVHPDALLDLCEAA